MEELSKELEKGQHEQAERLMHNVAGVAGNFGGEGLMQSARIIEHQIQQHEKITEAQITDLTDELQNFITAIEMLTERHHDKAVG